jgi:hypothetical protein
MKRVAKDKNGSKHILGLKMSKIFRRLFASYATAKGYGNEMHHIIILFKHKEIQYFNTKLV